MASGDDFDDDAFDDAEDAAWEDMDPEEYPIFTDFVAERALAFSLLAKKASLMEPGEIRDLSLVMLQAIVRSIKTAPQGELAAVQQKSQKD